MKNQFSIKPAQLLKNIAKSATKAESTSILKFAFLNEEQECCVNVGLGKDRIVALPR